MRRAESRCSWSAGTIPREHLRGGGGAGGRRESGSLASVYAEEKAKVTGLQGRTGCVGGKGAERMCEGAGGRAWVEMGR